jgi:hypothetical protein
MLKNLLKKSLSTKVKIISIFILFICFQSNVFSQTKNVVTWTELVAARAAMGLNLTSNHTVVVGVNDRLVINHGCTNLNIRTKGIVVYGELVIKDNASDCNGVLFLTADFILVAENGLFRVGSETDPFDDRFKLILSGDSDESLNLNMITNNLTSYVPTSIVGNREVASNSPSEQVLKSMIGDKNYSFLMAMGSNARIEMHSTDALTKKSWTQLDGTVAANSNVLNFAESTNWKVGDRIVLASTDYDLNQAEEFTITEVRNSGQNVTINPATEYMHYGVIESYSNGAKTWELDMRGEVGLLSRNVKVSGDVDYITGIPLNQQGDKFGGHIMAMMGAEMYISGVEFEYMGQAGQLGKYPTHWHMLGDVSNQYIKNSSYHHTFNKGMTIHGTENSLVENNVLYESIGHSVFLEDGSETGNTFRDNLAINARKPASESLEIPDSNDFTDPSNFWIENSNNIFEGNHSAGSEGHGFWFDLFGLNGLSDTNSNKVKFGFKDDLSGPEHFTGNVAHSTTDKAFGLTHGVLVNGEVYKGTNAKPQAIDESWHVEDYTGYKNLVSLYCRGIGGNYSDIKIGESETGTRFRLNQHMSNSLIVGRTGNIGTPSTSAEYAAGRSLGIDKGIFEGHQIYDGPAGIVDVHFEGFTEPEDYAINESNAVMKSVNHYVSGLTFGAGINEENKLHFDSGNGAEIKGVVDLDGSLTGITGGLIIESAGGNVNLLTDTPSAIVKSNWNAIIHQPSVTIGSIKVVSASKAQNSNALTSTNFHDGAPSNSQVNGQRVVLGGTVTTTLEIERSGEVAISNLRLAVGSRDQSLFVANDDSSYKMTITNAPRRFNFYVNELPMGNSVIYEIAGLNINYSDFNFGYADEGRVPHVNSLAQLESVATTSLFRNFATGTIYIKFVSQMRHGFLLPQPKVTFDDKELGGVIVHVTYNQELNLSTDKYETDLNKVFVYPNPVLDSFKLELSNNKSNINNIQIISATGVLVKEFDIQLEDYNISLLNEGVYFVIFRNNETVVYRKQILKK